MLMAQRYNLAATEYKKHIRLNHEIKFFYLQDFQLVSLENSACVVISRNLFYTVH